jgi:hypothetical protein
MQKRALEFFGKKMSKCYYSALPDNCDETVKFEVSRFEVDFSAAWISQIFSRQTAAVLI